MFYLLKISRSSYYEFLKSKVSNRAKENRYILKDIKISLENLSKQMVVQKSQIASIIKRLKSQK